MIEKEIAELRRRFRPDKSGVSHVRGCYVNEAGEIISQFDQSLGVMTQDENERIFTVLRKTLSGTLGKNLLDIEFETSQVAHGEEHRLLMRLRDSGLEDEEAVQTFFQRVIQSLSIEGTTSSCWPGTPTTFPSKAATATASTRVPPRSLLTFSAPSAP